MCLRSKVYMITHLLVRFRSTGARPAGRVLPLPIRFIQFQSFMGMEVFFLTVPPIMRHRSMINLVDLHMLTENARTHQDI